MSVFGQQKRTLKGRLRSISSYGPKSVAEGYALTHVWNVVGHHLRLNSNSIPNDYNINFYGKTTDDFKESVVEAYADLPSEARDDLVSSGLTVKVGESRGAIHPEWKSVYEDRGINDARVHDNQSPGVNLEGIHEIDIAEHFFWFRGPDWLVKFLGVEGNPTLLGKIIPQWRICSPRYGKEIVLHEAAGHEIYTLQGIGADQSYLDAYELDLKGLGGIEGAHEKGLTYFVYSYDPSDPSLDRGRSEVFSSIVQGQDGIIEKFPHCSTWVSEFYSHYDRYRIEPGSAAINRHIDTSDLIDTGLGHSGGGIHDVLGTEIDILGFHLDIAPSLTLAKLAVMSSSMFLLHIRMNDLNDQSLTNWQYFKNKTPAPVRKFAAASAELTRRSIVFVSGAALAAFGFGALMQGDAFSVDPATKGIVGLLGVYGAIKAVDAFRPPYRKSKLGPKQPKP